jgi:hypothetical protein
MHPKDHPLLKPRNFVELFLQSAFWIFFYGTGLVFFLQIFTWIAYGLSWYIHPKLYPLRHIMVLDLYAESMRWLRNESNLGKRRPLLMRVLVYLCTVAVGVGLPLLFITYFKFLVRLYLGLR